MLNSFGSEIRLYKGCLNEQIKKHLFNKKFFAYCELFLDRSIDMQSMLQKTEFVYRINLFDLNKEFFPDLVKINSLTFAITRDTCEALKFEDVMHC